MYVYLIGTVQNFCLAGVSLKGRRPDHMPSYISIESVNLMLLDLKDDWGVNKINLH